MSDVTQLNPALGSNATQLNPAVAGNATQLNPAVTGNATQLNPEFSASWMPEEGTVLLDRYIVTKRLTMEKETGEADLFLCMDNKKHCVAKLYRRSSGIKPEVVEVLQKLHSPYVAELYAYGKWEGRPLEVMEYFPRGSLQGRTFSVAELKEQIIPALNEGLHILHGAGIIHKDLKPSNIMLRSDGKTFALIDFGISSVENDMRINITRTGMTPEYGAPETFRGAFSEESDYYALGICLYELFTGKTPYQNRTADEIAQFSTLQQVPLPPDMPKPLGELIRALTYVDITHRNEKDNPNRRWTYEEVRAWCKDQPLPLPGSASGGHSLKMQYWFQNESFPNRRKLAEAMCENWESGKRELFRGQISGRNSTVDPELARFCQNAEDTAVETDQNENVIYMRLLAQINGGMLCWKGKSFENLSAFGQEVIASLRKKEMVGQLATVLHERVLSAYLETVSPDAKNEIKSVHMLEDMFALHTGNSPAQEMCCWLMGYLLSGNYELVIKGKSYWKLNVLQEHLHKLARSDFKEFEETIAALMPTAGVLEPQFEAWLHADGYAKQIERWRQGGVRG